MQKSLISLSFLLTLILAACGGSGAAPKNLDGFWMANLTNQDGSQAYQFGATLSQSSGPAINVSGFGFINSAPCFSSPTGQNATFSVTGHSGGYQTGSFNMTISTALGVDVENVITLTGQRNSDGTISGKWTLTGLSGCSGGGNYTMHAPPPL